MFINPDDRRLGNRRQQLTRAQIDRRLTDERNRRRRTMSDLSRIGQERLPRQRRSPFRGASAGTSFGAARPGGGRAQFLQFRGPGRGADERQYIEPPVIAPPRVQPPTPPRPLDQLGEERLNPAAYEFIRDAFGGQQTLTSALTPEIREQLMGPSTLQTAITPDILQQLMGPSQPQHPVGLDALAGLVPLGGGTWYDPNTGVLHGAGGGSHRMF